MKPDLQSSWACGLMKAMMSSAVSGIGNSRQYPNVKTCKIMYANIAEIDEAM
jgi:hypothetical protein